MSATLFNVGADGRTFWLEPELPFAADPDPVRIIIVGCTKAKRTTTSPAGDLYDASPLYRKRRRYAEQTGHRWAIMSARYGLVDPTADLDPYDYTIADRLRDNRHDRGRSFGTGIIQAAHRLAGIGASRRPGHRFTTWDAPLILEVHAGKPYADVLALAAENHNDTIIEHPVAGMQIGEQLRHYNEVTR